MFVYLGSQWIGVHYKMVDLSLMVLESSINQKFTEAHDILLFHVSTSPIMHSESSKNRS